MVPDRVVGLLLLWVSNIAALWVASRLLDGFGYDTTRSLLVGGAVLAAANWLLKPVLTILSLPFIIVTLGVAYLAICVLVLFLMAKVTGGIHGEGASWVWAAVIVGAVNMVLQPVLGVERSGKRRSGRGERGSR